MRKLIVAAIVMAFAAGASPSVAAPCKDARGKFIKCPAAKPAATKCRLNGKFASCGIKGAKPI